MPPDEKVHGWAALRADYGAALWIRTVAESTWCPAFCATRDQTRVLTASLMRHSMRRGARLLRYPNLPVRVVGRWHPYPQHPNPIRPGQGRRLGDLRVLYPPPHGSESSGPRWGAGPGPQLVDRSDSRMPHNLEFGHQVVAFVRMLGRSAPGAAGVRGYDRTAPWSFRGAALPTIACCVAHLRRASLLRPLKIQAHLRASGPSSACPAPALVISLVHHQRITFHESPAHASSFLHSGGAFCLLRCGSREVPDC